jgi:hypothetical protein
MRRNLTLLFLATAVVVAATTVADAVRQGTMAPLWQMAWLPAVLAAAFSRPTRRRCGGRR